jgi:hypothetical protein
MVSNRVLCRWLFTGFGAAGLAFAFACTSKSSGGSGGGGGPSFPPGSAEYTEADGATVALESPGTCSGTAGGAILGPDDNHCEAPDGAPIVQPTTPAGCVADAATGGGGGDAGDVDSGDPCPGDMNAYGPVMYNDWGADDDCKYDVSWQSTPICENEPVYFTVTVTRREDNTPLLGVQVNGSFVTGNPRPDVVLDCSHPIPNTPASRDPSPMVTPGTYVVGPVVFDKGGDWVFRFHFNEECLDIADDSPHGHAAFHINVP